MTGCTTVDRYTRPPGQVNPGSWVKLALKSISSLHGGRLQSANGFARGGTVLGSIRSFGVFRNDVLIFSRIIGLSR